MTAEPLVRRVLHYSGEVQGVGFRHQTWEAARGYRVTGYVQNLPDGRVLLVVEGVAGDLDALEAAVARRMRWSIGAVDRAEQPATGEFESFSIRR